MSVKKILKAICDIIPGIKKKEKDDLLQQIEEGISLAQFKKEVCLLIKSISKEADVNNSDQNSTEFEIKLTTLHSSKGLDADVVFIIGAEDQFIPNECLNQQEFYEKLRLFYVGITRAREQLFISYAKFRKDPLTKGYGGKRKRSRFLEDFYIPNKFKEKK